MSTKLNALTMEAVNIRSHERVLYEAVQNCNATEPWGFESVLYSFSLTYIINRLESDLDR